MVRLVHLSDIHITARPLGWRRGDWLNKRLAAWLNLRCLGRGLRFSRAAQVLELLVRELRQQPPDRVIFSGDATALGFESEVRRAADILELGSAAPLPGLAVPGNHDYVTRPVAASGVFERYFAPWQAGERVDDARYPFAQRVGDYWLIGVSSCTGNRWPWDAAGAVGPEQRDRLRRLLASLAPGIRILVTHYPVYLANGRRERPWHGLRDLDEMLELTAAGGIALWLHGHRHHAYRLIAAGGVPFPIICAGSATQNNLWSYMEYTLAGNACKAVRRAFAPGPGRFVECERFEIELRSVGAQHAQTDMRHTC
jgi:3',5'-cyclic AMP phosphodiesterase CpdA